MRACFPPAAVVVATAFLAAQPPRDWPQLYGSSRDSAAARIDARNARRMSILCPMFPRCSARTCVQSRTPTVFPSRPWLSGANLGALDLLAAVVSKWSGARQHLAQARPALHDALLRIDAHPGVADVFARHWPPKKAEP